MGERPEINDMGWHERWCLCDPCSKERAEEEERERELGCPGYVTLRARIEDLEALVAKLVAGGRS